MRGPDELTKHLSCTNRVASAADGSGILQCNSEARFHEIDSARQYGRGAPWSVDMKDYEYRRAYQRHFLEQGGSTFSRGDVLYDE